MTYRLFAAAMAAGLLVAVFISSIELVTTTPLILQGESYETASAVACSTKNCDITDLNAWKPQNGIERFLYTVLANAVTAIAFALILVVGLTIGEHDVDYTKGLLWAGAGFIVFTLAPLLGLPPELPGMPTADLLDRQIWWGVTVASTGAGLSALVFNRSPFFKGTGIILMILPHIWGAPQPSTHLTLVPATLAAKFATTSIIVSALQWALIGLFSVYCYNHFKPKT